MKKLTSGKKDHQAHAIKFLHVNILHRSYFRRKGDLFR